MCIARNSNADVSSTETGEEEPVGEFGFGTKKKDGRGLVELMTRNGLVVKGSFVLKRENHKMSRIGVEITSWNCLY